MPQKNDLDRLALPHLGKAEALVKRRIAEIARKPSSTPRPTTQEELLHVIHRYMALIKGRFSSAASGRKLMSIRTWGGATSSFR